MVQSIENGLLIQRACESDACLFVGNNQNCVLDWMFAFSFH